MSQVGQGHNASDTENDSEYSSDQEQDAISQALSYLRDHYDESYQARIELGADLARFTQEAGLPGEHLGSEAVLQPLIRYQGIAVEDVINQLENKLGEGDARVVLDMIVLFASEGASRHDTETSTSLSAIGDGRRKNLDAIEEKGQLDSVDGFASKEELLDAVKEISLVRGDRVYMAPHTKALEEIEWAFEDIPGDAESAYLSDGILQNRINTARSTFNDWLGRFRREQEMPSPIEAGPANYPAEKARETCKKQRSARKELADALDEVRAAASGARQRALEAINSSVSEHNQEKRDSEAESVKEQLEPGDVILHMTTSTGWIPWGVKRLNNKSVRLRRPHPQAGGEQPFGAGEYPTFDETTVNYDSDWLRCISRTAVTNLEEAVADIPDGNLGDIPAFESIQDAQEQLFGPDWVESNLE